MRDTASEATTAGKKNGGKSPHRAFYHPRHLHLIAVYQCLGKLTIFCYIPEVETQCDMDVGGGGVIQYDFKIVVQFPPTAIPLKRSSNKC